MAIGYELFVGDTCIWLPREIERMRKNMDHDSRCTATTVINIDELSVVMVAMADNGEIPEHVARGPITIHVLDGSMDIYSDGDRTTLGAGMLMALPRGTPHSATSDEGALFLLTVLK